MIDGIYSCRIYQGASLLDANQELTIGQEPDLRSTDGCGNCQGASSGGPENMGCNFAFSGILNEVLGPIGELPDGTAVTAGLTHPQLSLEQPAGDLANFLLTEATSNLGSSELPERIVGRLVHEALAQDARVNGTELTRLEEVQSLLAAVGLAASADTEFLNVQARKEVVAEMDTLARIVLDRFSDPSNIHKFNNIVLGAIHEAYRLNPPFGFNLNIRKNSAKLRTTNPSVGAHDAETKTSLHILEAMGGEYRAQKGTSHGLSNQTYGIKPIYTTFWQRAMSGSGKAEGERIRDRIEGLVVFHGSKDDVISSTTTKEMDDMNPFYLDGYHSLSHELVSSVAKTSIINTSRRATFPLDQPRMYALMQAYGSLQ